MESTDKSALDFSFQYSGQINSALQANEAKFHLHIDNITLLQQQLHDEEIELKKCLDEERKLRMQIASFVPAGAQVV